MLVCQHQNSKGHAAAVTNLSIHDTLTMLLDLGMFSSGGGLGLDIVACSRNIRSLALSPSATSYHDARRHQSNRDAAYVPHARWVECIHLNLARTDNDVIGTSTGVHQTSYLCSYRKFPLRSFPTQSTRSIAVYEAAKAVRSSRQRAAEETCPGVFEHFQISKIVSMAADLPMKAGLEGIPPFPR